MQCYPICCWVKKNHNKNNQNINYYYHYRYSDGSIRIWDSNSSMSNITFNGHKAAVTVLCFDSLGARLASGSKDTDLVVWDISGECGLFRLKGHKDQVTGLVFLPGSSSRIDHLVSTSKDTLMKVWDLSTQHCIETIIAHRSEVWGLAASLDGKFLFTGAIDQEIRVWKVDADLIARKLQVVAAISDKSKSSSSNSSGGDASKNRAEEEDVSMKEEENDDDAIKESVTLHGVLERQSKERVVSLKVHPTGRFLAVQATDKSIQVFKIRNEEELKKRLTRKKKRLREKKKLQITMEEVGTNSAAQHEETEELFTLADEVVMHCIIRCSGKVRSFDFSSSTSSNKKMHKGVAVMDDSFNVVCALSNNSIEVYACGANDDEEGEREEAIRLLSSLDLQGHRSDIRTLALSSNDELILSGSNSKLVHDVKRVF